MKTLASLVSFLALAASLSAETFSTQTFQFDEGSCKSVQHCVLTGYDKGHVVFFEWNILNGGYASLNVYLIQAFNASPLMSIKSGPDPDSPGNLRLEGYGSGVDSKNYKPFQIHFVITLHQYEPGETLFVVNPSGNRVTIATRK